MFLLLQKLLCTVSMTEYLLIVPELCCRSFKGECLLLKLKKVEVCIKDYFSVNIFPPNTWPHLSLMVCRRRNWKKTLIDNAVKTKLNKNREKKHLKNLKHSVEFKTVYITKTYPFPIISKNALRRYAAAFVDENLNTFFLNRTIRTRNINEIFLTLLFSLRFHDENTTVW